MPGRNIFVAPGLAEGPWHVRRLAAELRKLGFNLTDDIERADIIVAHSGGLHVAPKAARQLIRQSRPELIVWIGLPYWPGKPLALSLVQKIWHDFKAHFKQKVLGLWLCKTGWNLIYLIKEPLYGWRVAWSMRRKTPLELLSAPHNLVVRNHDDAWCTPEIQKYVGGAKVIEQDGEHDDVWLHPGTYARLIKDNQPDSN